MKTRLKITLLFIFLLLLGTLLYHLIPFKPDGELRARQKITETIWLVLLTAGSVASQLQISICFIVAPCHRTKYRRHLATFISFQALSDFNSDGCSLFPDSSLIDAKDWCTCCLEHDIAYWRGGTEAERLAADEALRDCVLQQTGDAQLAEAMYLGVRVGGSPYFKNWYRWGYGWNYERKYQALTEKEKALAASKLKEFFETDPDLPCKWEAQK